jgi:hypothetical protein
MMSKFLREYLGFPIPLTQKELLAEQLYIEYHYLTEQYDQRVCSGRTERGIAIPASGLQRRLSGAYAKSIQKRMREKAMELEIGDEDLATAKKKAECWSQKEIDGLYWKIDKRLLD